MSTIRIPEAAWAKTYAHLYSTPGEHFAFFLATWASSSGEPVFIVRDVLLIPDSEVEVTRTGWVMSNQTLTSAINEAVKTGCALVEVHNHGGTFPRFSRVDRAGFREIVPYMIDSLRGRPYGATVWGDKLIHGEYFAPDGRTGTLKSVAVVGKKLDQLVSLDDDELPLAPRFDRQTPWFGARGQRKLGRLKYGVVGLGGTGSQIAQNLVYLGGRRFVLVEHDASEETNMNRLVTAAAADIGTGKAVLARRLIRAVAPDAEVEIFEKRVHVPSVLDALKSVDVLFGCVDNDGARLLLNEFSLAYGIPYFDVGVGIGVENDMVVQVGGRLAVVVPGEACLHCMNQIDPDEARYWLSTEEQREFMRQRGYVSGLGIRAPSVVALNASLAAAAVNEFSIYISGLRALNALTEYDMLGVGRSVKGQWCTPVKVQRKPGCPACENLLLGDAACFETRYGHVT